MKWGLQRASELDLPVGTEAGDKGEGLYRKMGFSEIGTWIVEGIKLPVMRRERGAGAKIDEEKGRRVQG